MGWLRKLAGWFGWGRFVALLLLLGFLQLRASESPILEEFLRRTFDFYQAVSPREVKDHPVLIIDIDEQSLAAFGQWPWPRLRLATLVENVARNGGKAVAFDMAFPEPDRLNPANIASSLSLLDEATRQSLQRLPSNDRLFADAIAAGNVVLGRAAYTKPLANPYGDQLPQTGFATLGGDPRGFLRTFPGIIRNVPVLEQAAAGRGLFSLVPEYGGTIRRVPLVQNVQGHIAPTLALELLRVGSATPSLIVKRGQLGVQRIMVGKRAIPTDANARFWVHYGRHDKVRYISAKDVIENAPAAARLKDKFVFVGTSAVGLFDLKATPVHPAMPGVEIHAQVLENILAQSYLSRPANAVGGEILLALTVGLAVILLAPILGALRVLVLGGVLAVGLTGLSWYAYKEYRLLIDVAYPLLSSLAVFLVLVFVNYIREEGQRRQIRGAFGQYIAPAMVEQLSKDPSKLVLGGETRTLTLLFSDIRGFTSISETYLGNPQGLTALINRLLTPLSNAIIERRGTIDKYIGDAIVAFWNAPLDVDAHAGQACDAALAMLDELETINEKRRHEAAAEGREVVELRIGIGINTGECVVGNMGSELRFDYSVLGDSVNVCARLENQTKTYGLPILVGPSTAAEVGHKYAMLEIDRIRVAGKSEPTTVFALLGNEDVRRSDSFQGLQQRLANVLTAYRLGRFDEALTALNACRAVDQPFGLAPLFDLYAARLADFTESPPGPDWDGAVNMAKT